MLSHPGAPAGGASTSASSSGCAGPQTAGTVYISTNATVSIEICGQSYIVLAGTGGGLTYSYHVGILTFTAPSSVNGSAFKFWYAIIGDNTPARASSETLTLTLPPGLSSQLGDTALLHRTSGPRAVDDPRGQLHIVSLNPIIGIDRILIFFIILLRLNLDCDSKIGRESVAHLFTGVR